VTHFLVTYMHFSQVRFYNISNLLFVAFCTPINKLLQLIKTSLKFVVPAFHPRDEILGNISKLLVEDRKHNSLCELFLNS
jgi:hypothetical protein